MPKIGLRNPMYCTMTISEDVGGNETETLGAGRSMGKIVNADIQINAPTARYFADDGISEAVSEFVDGTISAELDDLADEIAKDIFGATLDEGELIFNETDNAAYARLGFVVTKIQRGIKKYRAIVFMKVQFQLPSEQFQTKGESITFSGTTLAGTIMRNKDGSWKKEKIFDELSDAIAYLKEQVNIIVQE